MYWQRRNRLPFKCRWMVSNSEKRIGAENNNPIQSVKIFVLHMCSLPHLSVEFKFYTFVAKKKNSKIELNGTWMGFYHTTPSLHQQDLMYFITGLVDENQR